MARTLSQDLRDRVVAAIDGGLSCRQRRLVSESALRAQFGGVSLLFDTAEPLPSCAVGTAIPHGSKRSAISS